MTRDRAAVVTATIIAIIARRGADPRDEIAATLRDEFADAARQAVHDTAPPDDDIPL